MKKGMRSQCSPLSLRAQRVNQGEGLGVRRWKTEWSSGRACAGGLLIALSTLALVGCGPKSEGDKARGISAEMTTVRLAFFPNVTHAVALVGTGNGAFAKALGANVELKEQVFTAGPSEIEAVFG